VLTTIRLKFRTIKLTSQKLSTNILNKALNLLALEEWMLWAENNRPKHTCPPNNTSEHSCLEINDFYTKNYCAILIYRLRMVFEQHDQAAREISQHNPATMSTHNKRLEDSRDFLSDPVFTFLVIGVPIIAIFLISLCIWGIYRSNRAHERIGRAQHAEMATETHPYPNGDRHSMDSRTLFN
jgi:hypothetical protein